MTLTSPTVFAFTFCTAAVSLWLYSRRHSRRQPPGPTGIPLLGNLFDVPTLHPWITYAKWSKIYDSGILQANVLGTNLIIINKQDIAIELLEKRSSIYSDRPWFTMLDDLMNLHWAIAFLPYGERWRETRKASHQGYNSQVVKRFRETEKKGVHQLLRRLMHQPKGYYQALRHMAGSLIIQISYGFEVQAENDPFMRIGEKTVEAIAAASNTGTYLVDVIPILRFVPEWFPGAQFKRDAKAWRKAMEGLQDAPFDHAKKCQAEGTSVLAGNSVAAMLFEDMSKKGKDPVAAESIIKDTLASMFPAGADTTISTLSTFLLAMILYPEVQRKAQEEIDRVVGAARLPDFSDRESLPYINAIVNETFRYHPVLPLIPPHGLMQDDEYNGYFIPKGSFVIANCWAILHDEEMYPSPHVFNPDRFLTKDGQVNPDILDPTEAMFGFGRRICPGRFLVKETVWITMACILATFNIEKGKDEEGNLVTPKEEFTSGMLSYPLPFPCDFRPRSKEHEGLIESTSHMG